MHVNFLLPVMKVKLNEMHKKKWFKIMEILCKYYDHFGGCNYILLLLLTTMHRAPAHWFELPIVVVALRCGPGGVICTLVSFANRQRGYHFCNANL